MTVYALSTFADKLRIASDSFTLSDGSMRHAQPRGGLLVRSQNGARLWQGSITLAPYKLDDAGRRAVGAVLRDLLRPDAFFLFGDPLAEYPLLDPDGSNIGSATPELSAVSSGGGSIGIDGLPAGYRLRAGDRFSFSYGSSPTRYAYHEVLESATASSGGSVSGLSVSPAIRPGATVGAALDFTRPTLRAAIVPDSVQAATRSRGFDQGASFDWVQSLTAS